LLKQKISQKCFILPNDTAMLQMSRLTARQMKNASAVAYNPDK